MFYSTLIGAANYFADSKGEKIATRFLDLITVVTELGQGHVHPD
jgi:hypothetical protein